MPMRIVEIVSMDKRDQLSQVYIKFVKTVKAVFYLSDSYLTDICSTFAFPYKFRY